MQNAELKALPTIHFRSLKNTEPNARCSLQYDRLYVENEVYLFNEIEQKVERMLMNRNYDGANLFTPRGLGPPQAGGRFSRIRKCFESRDEANNENLNGSSTEDCKNESITEIEADLLQSGNILY